jgi:hypothetical protein
MPRGIAFVLLGAILLALSGCKPKTKNGAQTVSPVDASAVNISSVHVSPISVAPVAAAHSAPSASTSTSTPTPPAAPVPPPPPSPENPPRPSGPIEFTDVTAQAGIRFKHNSGAFGKKYLPETMGSGVFFFDY